MLAKADPLVVGAEVIADKKVENDPDGTVTNVSCKKPYEWVLAQQQAQPSVTPLHGIRTSKDFRCAASELLLSKCLNNLAKVSKLN